jgi:hypothetical protein
MNFDSGIARVVQVIDAAGVAAMVLAIGVACVLTATQSAHHGVTDGAAPVGTDATLSPWRARRMVMGKTDQMVWDGVRLAHDPAAVP